jgi:uncharacterized protein YxjI
MYPLHQIARLDSGERGFEVDGKAMGIRKTFVLCDASGAEVAKIQERKLTVRDTMTIERPYGEATVRKALVGIQDGLCGVLSRSISLAMFLWQN